MSDLILNASDLPGIHEAWANWRGVGEDLGLWEQVGGWSEPGHHDTLPLDQPMAQDLACYWLEKQGHPCEWARRIPAALAECCRRVGRGEKPLRGALATWAMDWTSYKRAVRHDDNGTGWSEVVEDGAGGVWWYMGGARIGCASFEDAQRLADEAAHAAGWWLS